MIRAPSQNEACYLAFHTNQVRHYRSESVRNTFLQPPLLRWGVTNCFLVGAFTVLHFKYKYKAQNKSL